MKIPGGLVLAGFLLLAGCAPALREPVPVSGSAPGQIDLRTWNFDTDGPVLPQSWLWDLGILWSPETGGRPDGLSAALVSGPLDRGTGFSGSQAVSGGRISSATASLTFRVADRQDYGLQIGAFPGAYRVWVNGVLVWESGVCSADPGLYRANGAGITLTVQPREGLLSVVVGMATDDPLVIHPEMNRLWVLGPAAPMLGAQASEQSFRILQVIVLSLGILIFLWIASLRPERRTLVYFVWFLGACVLKLLVNIEQPAPLLSPFFPGVPLSLYLFLNHGLNLLPYPLLVLFLARQFPEDVSFRSFGWMAVLTVLMEIWELLPLACLAGGWTSGYRLILGGPWAFILNLYVVLATLFIFERFYHLHSRHRPLSGALFFGGIAIGLVILIPVPLSYFIPVKYTYFFGWGLFFFLMTLILALVRLQVRSTDAEVRALQARLDLLDNLNRYIDPAWAVRMGRTAVADLRSGDRRTTEAILVQVRSSDSPDFWLPAVGRVAAIRQAILVDWKDGTGIWALDAWSETGLAFALEVQRVLGALQGLRFKVVLTRSPVEYRILSAEPQWLPAVTGLPRARLDELHGMADRSGAVVVLDGDLQDGLVIGGWRRHRHLTVSGREIELYEGEEETLAQLKDQNLDAFEEALAHARAGRYEEGSQVLVDLIHRNPFDQTARTLLTEWRTPFNP